MNKNLVIGIVLTVSFLIIIVISYFSMMVSYQNENITRKNQINAQQTTCMAFFDDMYKTIAEKAEIVGDYRNTFKEVYPTIMEGRYGNEQGGTLMKWITESNPNFDVSLYKELMQTIEAKRDQFFMEQKKLIDLNNYHRTFLQKWPANMFISQKDTIHINIITSSTTKNVYGTGEENDIKLFKDEKK